MENITVRSSKLLVGLPSFGDSGCCRNALHNIETLCYRVLNANKIANFIFEDAVRRRVKITKILVP